MTEVTDEMLEAVVWVLTHEDESIDTKIILAVAPLIEAQARAEIERLQNTDDGWKPLSEEIIHLRSDLAQARAAVIEECAKVAEAATKAPGQRNAKDQWRESIGLECAAAIRALTSRQRTRGQLT